MEVLGAAVGAMRVGLQIVVGQKRPVLEIYQIVHNRIKQPVELVPAHGTVPAQTFRFQEIFVGLSLVNIGAVRAENVTFELRGDFKRAAPRDEMPSVLKSEIKQIPPGNSMFLMRIEISDLHNYVEDENYPAASHPAGISTDQLKIAIHYDGPPSILNGLMRWHRRWRRLKQYQTNFTFVPMTVAGDLPPTTSE
jgi:hypothetical protein